MEKAYGRSFPHTHFCLSVFLQPAYVQWKRSPAPEQTRCSLLSSAKLEGLHASSSSSSQTERLNITGSMTNT
ncbi:hypothetical protein Nmel_006040 [Mimus melanotis]